MSTLVKPFASQGKNYPGVRFVGPTESLPARPQGAAWRKLLFAGTAIAGLLSCATFDDIADDPGVATGGIPNTDDGFPLIQFGIGNQSFERAYINTMNEAAISARDAGGAVVMDQWAMLANGYIEPDGTMLNGMPPGATQINFWRFRETANAGYRTWSAGTYVLEWQDTDGNTVCFGSREVSAGGNRDVAPTGAATGRKEMDFDASNGNAAHLEFNAIGANFKILKFCKLEDEADFNAGEIFRSDWADWYKRGKYIRTMDLNATNTTSVTKAAHFPAFTAPQWNADPVWTLRWREEGIPDTPISVPHRVHFEMAKKAGLGLWLVVPPYLGMPDAMRNQGLPVEASLTGGETASIHRFYTLDPASGGGNINVTLPADGGNFVYFLTGPTVSASDTVTLKTGGGSTVVVLDTPNRYVRTKGGAVDFNVESDPADPLAPHTVPVFWERTNRKKNDGAAYSSAEWPSNNDWNALDTIAADNYAAILASPEWDNYFADIVQAMDDCGWQEDWEVILEGPGNEIWNFGNPFGRATHYFTGLSIANAGGNTWFVHSYFTGMCAVKFQAALDAAGRSNQKWRVAIALQNAYDAAQSTAKINGFKQYFTDNSLDIAPYLKSGGGKAGGSTAPYAFDVWNRAGGVRPASAEADPAALTGGETMAAGNFYNPDPSAGGGNIDVFLPTTAGLVDGDGLHIVLGENISATDTVTVKESDGTTVFATYGGGKAGHFVRIEISGGVWTQLYDNSSGSTYAEKFDNAKTAFAILTAIEADSAGFMTEATDWFIDTPAGSGLSTTAQVIVWRQVHIDNFDANDLGFVGSYEGGIQIDYPSCLNSDPRFYTWLRAWSVSADLARADIDHHTRLIAQQPDAVSAQFITIQDMSSEIAAATKQPARWGLGFYSDIGQGGRIDTFAAAMLREAA